MVFVGCACVIVCESRALSCVRYRLLATQHQCAGSVLAAKRLVIYKLVNPSVCPSIDSETRRWILAILVALESWSKFRNNSHFGFSNIKIKSCYFSIFLHFSVEANVEDLTMDRYLEDSGS
jgi:hypothetical protein